MKSTTSNKQLSKSVLFWIVLLTTLFAGQLQAQGVIYYSLENGSLVGLHMSVGPYNGPVLGPAGFFGTPPPPAATARNIAYDRVADLMWYAASDNHVHSIDWGSGNAGPTINDINDGFYGAIRTLAIDENGRRLYIATSGGDLKVYNLSNNTYMYTIPFTVWGMSEPNPGNRRHVAVDDIGFLWYAAADGSFKQFNPSQTNWGYTGVEIPFSEQIGSNPGQERYFDIVKWPAGQHYLYYAASDSSVRVLDLDSLSNVNIQFQASDFATVSMPGTQRAISIDESWVATGNPPSTPSNVMASKGVFPDKVTVTWTAVSNTTSYALFRRDPGQSDWTLWNSLVLDTTSDDTAAVPGVIYEYSVKACNQWGCGNFSAFDTGWAANTALSAPSNVTASQGDFIDRIEVSWNAVTGATAYNISIQPSTGLPFSVNAMSSNYTHLAPGPLWDVWTYSLSSCSNATGCGAQSQAVQGWKGDRIFANGFD